MKLFARLGGKGPRLSFQKGDLTETAEIFSNPARGWYQIHSFAVDQEPDWEELARCLGPEDTLAMVLLDIGGYRDRDLDGEATDRIRRILRFFAERKYDCILRAVYDRAGKAAEREPSFFEQVLAHLRQVLAAAGEVPGSVFVYQGVLVGNWGEMHGSRFLGGGRLVRLAEVLRANRPQGAWLAVRRPVQWRQLHSGQAGGAPDCQDGMGLFDDGMFGSPSHLGTFGEDSQAGGPWDAPWPRAQELAFENALCRQAPNGGEAVYGEGYARQLSPGDVINVLQDMQVTYLNRQYDQDILDIWRDWKLLCRGAWSKVSLFDYIGAHLGYRLVVRDVKAAADRRTGRLRVEVEAENTGFASLYQDAWIALEYTGLAGERQRSVLPENLGGWESGQVREFVWEIEPGSGALLLLAGRARDNAPIRFGNRSDGDGKLCLGSVCRE